MEGQPQSKFEGWAVLEIFGHQRYAGYVTTEAFGQAVLFRVDVPPLAERERITKAWEYRGIEIPPGSTVKELAVQGYTKLFGAGAIYGITPCTQEFATKAVEEMQSREMQVVKLAEPRQKALPAEVVEDEIECVECGALLFGADVIEAHRLKSGHSVATR